MGTNNLQSEATIQMTLTALIKSSQTWKSMYSLTAPMPHSESREMSIYCWKAEHGLLLARSSDRERMQEDFWDHAARRLSLKCPPKASVRNAWFTLVMLICRRSGNFRWWGLARSRSLVTCLLSLCQVPGPFLHLCYEGKQFLCHIRPAVILLKYRQARNHGRNLLKLYDKISSLPLCYLQRVFCHCKERVGLLRVLGLGAARSDVLSLWNLMKPCICGLCTFPTVPLNLVKRRSDTATKHLSASTAPVPSPILGFVSVWYLHLGRRRHISVQFLCACSFLS